MAQSPSPRRRSAVHITLQRAARLHHLVRLLLESPRTREVILSQLRIGLRTFYREVDLLKRYGVKVRHKEKHYSLLSTAEQAEGRLPFPDPQLSFAEMAELANCPCNAGRRLAELLASVISHPAVEAKPSPRGSKRRGAKTNDRPGTNRHG